MQPGFKSVPLQHRNGSTKTETGTELYKEKLKFPIFVVLMFKKRAGYNHETVPLALSHSAVWPWLSVSSQVVLTSITCCSWFWSPLWVSKFFGSVKEQKKDGRTHPEAGSEQRYVYTMRTRRWRVVRIASKCSTKNRIAWVTVILMTFASWKTHIFFKKKKKKTQKVNLCWVSLRTQDCRKNGHLKPPLPGRVFQDSRKTELQHTFQRRARCYLPLLHFMIVFSRFLQIQLHLCVFWDMPRTSSGYNYLWERTKE